MYANGLVPHSYASVSIFNLGAPMPQRGLEPSKSLLLLAQHGDVLRHRWRSQGRGRKGPLLSSWASARQVLVDCLDRPSKVPLEIVDLHARTPDLQADMRG